MRCPNCTLVCSPADPFCPSCQRPLVVGRRTQSSRSGASKYALMGMIIAEAFFNTFGRRWFPSIEPGISLELCMWGGIVGAGGAVVGAFFGMLLGGPADAR